MATFRKTEAAQYPLIAEAVINFGDTVAPSAGGSDVALNQTTVNVTFDIADLPYGASVIGGDVVVETAFNGIGTGTAVLDIGDAASGARYANDVDLETAARTALTITGFEMTSAGALRATVVYASAQAAPTAGKARVRVMYVIKDRVSENT